MPASVTEYQNIVLVLVVVVVLAGPFESDNEDDDDSHRTEDVGKRPDGSLGSALA